MHLYAKFHTALRNTKGVLLSRKDVKNLNYTSGGDIYFKANHSLPPAEYYKDGKKICLQSSIKFSSLTEHFLNM